jgi:hypothetical protein
MGLNNDIGIDSHPDVVLRNPQPLSPQPRVFSIKRTSTENAYQSVHRTDFCALRSISISIRQGLLQGKFFGARMASKNIFSRSEILEHVV